jgi:glutamate racemase
MALFPKSKIKLSLFHIKIMERFPIGIFDSGYGGLTILKEIISKLPEYDFIYLGDNARSPYGTRSFDVVYDFTLEAVNFLFDQGCPLVILACNTASAKALRTIQQNNLPFIDVNKRVLGVIRPSAELIGSITKTRHVGILATQGTVSSESYVLEIGKTDPDIIVSQHACNLWVPLIENNLHDTQGGHFFIQKDIEELLVKDCEIDTIILACTHYPIVKSIIEKYVPDHIKVIAQGPIVAESLSDYLQRHPEMDNQLSKNGSKLFLTTETSSSFDKNASLIFGDVIISKHVQIS